MQSQASIALRHIRSLVAAQSGHYSSDRTLLDRYVEHGEDAAFAALLKRYSPLVLSVCRRVLDDWHAADDAFQATFLVLSRKAHSIRKQQALSSWLHAVAFRVSLRARSKANKHRHSKLPDGCETVSDPLADMTVRELRLVLDEELHRIPAKYSAPLLLCFVEGKTRDEAARQLGCPLGTFSSRLDRARELLRGRLTRRGLGLLTTLSAAHMAQNAEASIVSPALFEATMRATRAFATGKMTAAGSTMALAMAEAAMASMRPRSWKLASIVALVALGILAGGSSIQQAADLPLAQTAQESGAPTAVQPVNENQQAENQRKAAGVEVREETVAHVGNHAGEPKLWVTIEGQGAGIRWVSFSPDGKIMATCCHGNTVKLWDVATCKLRATLRDRIGQISFVVFSPDGKTLAWTEDGTVKLWDVATGKERSTLKGHTGGVVSVAFSRDSKTLASAGWADGTVKVWDVATGKEQTTLTGHAGQPWCVAFSPDGRTLAVGSGTTVLDAPVEIKLWDVTTSEERGTLQGHTGYVFALVFSPDGKTLASGGGYPGTNPKEHGDVKLWEVASGKERAFLKGHTNVVNSVAFSPDGRILASASSDNTMRLWEVASGKERAILKGQDKPTSWISFNNGPKIPSYCTGGATFSPDGKIVAMGSHTAIMLWNMPATQAVDKAAGPAQASNLSPQDLNQLWTTLAGEATKAYHAIHTLSGAPEQATLLLKERLRPASEPNTPQIARLIADLDSAQFTARQKADQDLVKMGEGAEAALRKKLAEQPPLEVRKRIEQVLAKIRLSPESLQALRAVEVLEHIGSPEAKQVLQTLAKGAEGFRLTLEAKASLERLDKRAAAAP
jgi:RNA polymerase sigma factor (sigma-70 family)